MELLAKDLAIAFQDRKGNFLDVAEWQGVECDGSRNVTSIRWDGVKSFPVQIPKFKRNSIDFRWIPRTVENIEIRKISIDFFDAVHFPSSAKRVVMTSNIRTKVSGSLETESLPTHLEFIDMSANVLAGDVDCALLPRTIEYFVIDRNQFSGSLCMTNLPESIVAMLMHENKFSEEIDLSKLPQRLRLLTLHENNLCGSVWLDGFLPYVTRINKGDRLKHLMPASGRALFIFKNQFSGKLVSHDGSNDQKKFFCAFNRFTSIDWGTMQRVENLDVNTNAVCGTLDCSAIPSAMRFLNLAHNALCGTLNISKLGPNMRNLDASHNQITGTINLAGATLVRLFLQGNQIQKVQFDAEMHMPRIEKILLQNNKIQQETVFLPTFTQRLERIDLRGNDIKCCLRESGELEKSQRILYDNGTLAQRYPDEEKKS